MREEKGERKYARLKRNIPKKKSQKNERDMAQCLQVGDLSTKMLDLSQ